MARKAFSVVVLLVGLLLVVSGAYADTISIGVQQGAGPIVQVASGNGIASAIGSRYGTFTLNNITAVGSPFLPEPQLGSTAFSVSGSTAGTITIYATELGIDPSAAIRGLTSSFTSNSLPAGWTVTEATYIDPSDNLFTTATLLNSASFIGPIANHTSAGNAFPDLTRPFSETEVFMIHAAGAGSTNDTIGVSAVPEPASLVLLGSGLFGLVGAVRRRR